LADAGYPNGEGLPVIQFAAGGLTVAGGIKADLERELGVHVELDVIDNAQARLNTDPPAMWSSGWIADYLGPNDFLGVILGTGANDNYGRWSSPAFDAAGADAPPTPHPPTPPAAFQRAPPRGPPPPP